jgi:hypothetical protein
MVSMNLAIGLSILTFSGIAAAQTASLQGKPFFDLPLFLPSAAFSDSGQAGDSAHPDAPGAPADSTVQAPSAPAPAPVAPPQDKRAFGVLPNYRTAESSVPFSPITPKQKLLIATKDSFDYPVWFTTAFFAGVSQLQGSDNNVYGQGVEGLARRYAVSYADQVVGNYFPEFIVPTLLHVDPRYFRKGEGSIKSRFGYAVEHLFICKSDKGNTTFNSPEILGNALASITGLSYHSRERTTGDALYQWGVTYIGADAVGQVLKEFWPDIKRKMFKKHQVASTQ